MQWLHRVLRGLLLTVLLTLCAVLFYLLVIMGGGLSTDMYAEPTASPAPLSAMPQPSLSFSARDVYQVTYYFNAPILALSSASGWYLQEATVEERVPDGMQESIREIRLRYAKEDGATVFLSSITPDTFIKTLTADGFVTASDQSMTIAGMNAVMMSNGTTQRLHAQWGNTVYQIKGDVGADILKKVAASCVLESSSAGGT